MFSSDSKQSPGKKMRSRMVAGTCPHPTCPFNDINHPEYKKWAKRKSQHELFERQKNGRLYLQEICIACRGEVIWQRRLYDKKRAEVFQVPGYVKQNTGE